MKAAAAIGLAFWLAAQAASAAEWNVGQLLELLRTHRPAKATFHETKYLALLDRPVESSGELTFIPPDRLEKRSTGLNAERMVVDRETLTIERAGRKQTLSLREYPQAGALVEGIRGTLAGDREALERIYSLVLEGDAQRWKLTLRPKDEKLRRIVARIEIGGSQAVVRRVDVEQADGDRSQMVVTPVGP